MLTKKAVTVLLMTSAGHHTASKHFQEKQCKCPSRFILHLEHGTESHICFEGSEGMRTPADRQTRSWGGMNLSGSSAVCLPVFPSLAVSTRVFLAAHPGVAEIMTHSFS